MFRAIRRSLSEGIRGMVKNGLMTVTSVLVVTACIFVFGVFLMFIFNLNNMTNEMADSYQVDVYAARDVKVDNQAIGIFIERDDGMDDAAYEMKKDNIRTLIMSISNVDISTIEFVSARQRFDEFVAQLSTEDQQKYAEITVLPLGDSFSVKLEDYSLKAATEMQLAEISGVTQVKDADSSFRTLAMAGGISLEVSDDRYAEIKMQLKEDLIKIANIDAESIVEIDGVQKFNDYKAERSEEERKAYDALPDDLIPDGYSVRLKDLSQAEETIAQITQLENVYKVSNKRDVITLIENAKDAVQKFSIWIIVAFVLVSLFIISNTIKLTVHNRRKEINIMKYVGATDSYIRGPFIMEGILVGLLSAVIAYFISQWGYEGVLAALGTSLSSYAASMSFMEFYEFWGTLLASYMALGGIIGAFGSFISVRRYLHV